MPFAKEPEQNTPIDIDTIIGLHLGSTPEQQLEHWTMLEFTSNFPKIVERVLSADGLQTYSQDQRKQLYTSALTALNQLPYAATNIYQRQGRRGTPNTPFLEGAQSYYYLHSEVGSTQKANSKDKRHEYILRMIFPSATLLGMSIDPGDFSEINKMTQIGQRRDKVREALELCLDQTSNAWQWVKENKFEERLGKNWDTTFARIVLSYTTGKRLLSVMTVADSEHYSDEVLLEFIEFAVAASEMPKGKLSFDLVDDLKKFANLLMPKFPSELKKRPHVNAAYWVINDNINQVIPDERFNQPNIQKQVDAAQNYMKKRAALKKGWRWTAKQVEELMS